MKKTEEDQFTDEETERRVQAALRGAFKGSPTQRRNIPRKPRASRVKKAATSAKNARRAP